MKTNVFCTLTRIHSSPVQHVFYDSGYDRARSALRPHIHAITNRGIRVCTCCAAVTLYKVDTRAECIHDWPHVCTSWPTARSKIMHLSMAIVKRRTALVVLLTPGPYQTRTTWRQRFAFFVRTWRPRTTNVPTVSQCDIFGAWRRKLLWNDGKTIKIDLKVINAH